MPAPARRRCGRASAERLAARDLRASTSRRPSPPSPGELRALPGDGDGGARADPGRLAADAAIVGLHDTSDRLRHVTAPTLVIHGDRDEMLRRAERRADRAAHPRRAARDRCAASGTSSGGSSPSAARLVLEHARTIRRLRRRPSCQGAVPSTARWPGGGARRARAGWSTPSSSSTRDDHRGAGRRVWSPAPGIASSSRSSAALAVARVERARTAASMSRSSACVEADACGEAVGLEAARRVRRASRAPRRPRRARSRIRASATAASERPGCSSSAAQRGLVALLDEQVGLGRDEAGRRTRSTIAGPWAPTNSSTTRAVLERLDGRDALDAERLRDAGVRVGVELGEHHLALALGGRLLEHGSERRGTGPHHSAQKSTTTGTSCDRAITSRSKSASATSITVMDQA